MHLMYQDFYENILLTKGLISSWEIFVAKRMLLYFEDSIMCFHPTLTYKNLTIQLIKIW